MDQKENPDDMKVYWNVWKKFIACLLLAVILFSIWNIAGYYIEGYKTREYSAYLRQEAGIVEQEQEQKQDENETEVSAPPESKQVIPQRVAFEELQKISKDVVAWIYIPGTEIDYVIAQTDNNSYYLDSQLNGGYSAGGTLFMDYHNAPDLSDFNTIIYGHHMKNGTMFGSLKNYKEQEYYESHPVVYLYTPKQNYRVELIAAYTTDPEDSIYTIPGTKEERDKIVANAIEKSDFTSDVSVEDGDRLVTLSTCAYDFKDARYVVLGKLVEE